MTTTITVTITVDDTSLPDIWAWIEEQFDENYAPDGVQFIAIKRE